MAFTIRIQAEDFDAGTELERLRRAHSDAGAVVAFIGQVRDLNDGDDVASLTLEHYAGMTEKSLERILTEANNRWAILDALVIHRIGTLHPLEQIVLVAVIAAHRGDAFHACEFIMDFLKTDAPFWKKERTGTGERWLDARAEDHAAKARWQGELPNSTD